MGDSVMGDYLSEALMLSGLALISLLVWVLINTKSLGGQGLFPDYKNISGENHAKPKIPPPVKRERRAFVDVAQVIAEQAEDITFLRAQNRVLRKQISTISRAVSIAQEQEEEE